MINVVNMKDLGFGWREMSEYIYIGRGSVFGNIYKIGKNGSRDEVIEMYLEWLRGEWRNKGKVYRELMKLVGRVKNGENIKLVCFCKPKKCHGDVIKYSIEKIIEKGG